MAFSLSGFLKGISLQDTSDRTKQLNLTVDPSATTGTSTTIVAAQTANRTLTLPDGSGPLSSSDSVETLTNKTIDAGSNTITNLANANIASGAAIAVNKLAAQTPTRALISDGSGFMTTSVTTATEIGYVSGVTSNIQAQLNSAAVNPMTTLGDMLYENASPAPTRLPGNTTATKNFLTQTGTGVISAAPAWGAILAADVPSLDFSKITTGTVPLTQGGTGQTTANASLNALLPSQTGNATKALVTDGTNTSWSIPSTAWSRVMGARSVNNTSNPTFQIDMTANVVILSNASGQTVMINNPGTVTVSKNVAGPTANGRDQAGAFSAGSWVHTYWIWDGVTLATLVSLNAPPTAPTLPSGYTYWAYHGAFYINAIGDFNSFTQRGSWVYWSNTNTYGVGLTSIGPADVALTFAAPTNCLNYAIRYYGQVVSNGSGVVNGALLLYSTGSVQFTPLDFALTGLGASATQAVLNGTIILPNFAYATRYSWSMAIGTSPSAQFNILGFQIPNGGE